MFDRPKLTVGCSANGRRKKKKKKKSRKRRRKRKKKNALVCLNTV